MAQMVWTDLEVITQLSSGSRWSGSVITYAFPTLRQNIYGSSGEQAGFSPLNTTQIAAAQLAVFTWDDLIRPNFQQTANSSSNIEFGYSSTGVDYAHAYLPTTGSIWFSNRYQTLADPIVGLSGFDTYVHEIGHALGLNHMGDYNGSDKSGPSSWQDSSVYTVMSYYGPNNSLEGEGLVAWADWVGSDGVEYTAQTPMINDVMAIQSIYGQATTRAGDTVYGFESTLTGQEASLYNFTNNAHPILCLYDSGGIDTLNLSAWSSASAVDLVGGANHFTSCNDMTNNIQIARGVLIENATTGAGNDVITGNDADNLLRSNAGNDTLSGGMGSDTLFGGAGTDTMLLTGSRSDFLVDYQASTASYIVSDKRVQGSVDYASEIEWAQFSDGSRVEIPFLASSSVFRFYNTLNGVHFYTGSSIEAENVKDTLSAYNFEGVAFDKANSLSGDVINVYRFFNTAKGAHFYTASEQEVLAIKASLPEYLYEGVAYQAHSQLSADTTALYRFFNNQTGTHFYTASADEKANVLLTLSGTMNYEGIAFYVDL